MKITKIAMLVLTVAVALFILIPSLSWAEDGAALYKAKRAMCHGPDGAGKPAAKRQPSHPGSEGEVGCGPGSRKFSRRIRSTLPWPRL